MICLIAPQTRASHVSGPLSPQEAVRSFEIEPGLRIECVAAEPLVVDPVALAFDERGRMYVVEMRDYPAEPGEPIGRVALLEDRDRDGVCETRREFAGGLISPNGVAVWDGGVFVTCAPDVVYLKDTDGDGRADQREVVFTGFAIGESSQLRVNHPALGLDNWVYLANGMSGGAVVSPQHPDRAPLKLGRSDLRFRPGTGEFEAVGGFAQFGLTFDDYGRRFICMNRRHCDQVVLEPAYLQRNPHLAFTETIADISDHGAAARVYPISRAVTTAAVHAGTFTAACGITVYRGTALGPQYTGNSFTCEPTGNLVHRDVLRPGGAAMVAARAGEGTEFLRSTDEWFRPVNLANGPDGALYVCDMYRRTIEHPRYLPEEIRKITDFVSGNDRGRLWRIRREGKAAGERKPIDLPALDDDELALCLTSPEAWYRETAQRLIIERADKSVADFIRAAFARAGEDPGRVHALWTLEGLGALEDSDVLRGLEDAAPGVRENAVRLAEPRLERSQYLAEKVLELAEDADARVRFQVALSLGALDEPPVMDALVAVAWRDLPDRFTRAAVLSSCAGRTGVFFGAFLDRLSRTDAVPLHEREGLVPMVRLASTTVGSAEPIEVCAGVLDRILGREAIRAWQFAGARGLIDGLRRSGKLPAGRKPLAALAEKFSPSHGVNTTGSIRPWGERIDSLVKAATRAAEDAELAVEERVEAIGLLGHAQDDAAAQVLTRLLDAGHRREIQLAAIQALTAQLDAARLRMLLAEDAFGSYLPPVRDALVTAVLGRPAMAGVLLEAVESGAMQPLAIAPAQRDKLARHADAAIRERAQKLFERAGAGDRRKAYEQTLRVLSLPAQAQRGRAVFARLCRQCHQMEGEGTAVGPDLTGVRNQAPETLLLHIVIPEHEIAPGYGNIIVETTDGQIHSGLLMAETPTSVTLRHAEGQEGTVLRSEIAHMYQDTLSMMPQELEKNMTEQELADLIAYLRGGRPDGGAPRSQPDE